MDRVRGFIAIIAASTPLAWGSIVLATPAQAAPPPPPPRLATVGGVDPVRGVTSTANTLPKVGLDANTLTGNGVPKVGVDPKGLTNPAGSGVGNTVRSLGGTVSGVGGTVGTVGGVGGVLGSGKPS
ncbi:hypothetical protein AB0K09_11520 [Streptomyces sp. NPDC049577]|uniref:hypothetical protein n=1 Tax=Streptomyces sp. NPDC049577 TaxID=3155153 RepID=UPI003420B420